MTCKPCRREKRRPGRHRAHPCDREFQVGSAMSRCSCPCNEPSPSLNPPPMDLGSLPLVEWAPEEPGGPTATHLCCGGGE